MIALGDDVARLQAAPFLAGFRFTEAPRWRDGELWFVDMGARSVYRATPGGQVEQVVTLSDDEPGGLGFLPDGTPLVVLKTQRRVCRIEGGGLQMHADLSPYPGQRLNDMAVDSAGRAYVGCLTSHRRRLENVEDQIILVEPDGRSRVATSEVLGPNGIAISADGRRVTVAQTWLSTLTSVTVEDNGTLTDPVVVADVGYTPVDGLCADAEGAFWVGGLDRGFFRVLPGGRITHRVDVGDRLAVACVLGGHDRRTLYMTTAELGPGPLTPGTAPANARAFVEVAAVDVPGSGVP